MQRGIARSQAHTVRVGAEVEARRWQTPGSARLSCPFGSAPTFPRELLLRACISSSICAITPQYRQPSAHNPPLAIHPSATDWSLATTRVTHTLPSVRSSAAPCRPRFRPFPNPDSQASTSRSSTAGRTSKLHSLGIAEYRLGKREQAIANQATRPPSPRMPPAGGRMHPS